MTVLPVLNKIFSNVPAVSDVPSFLRLSGKSGAVLASQEL